MHFPVSVTDPAVYCALLQFLHSQSHDILSDKTECTPDRAGSYPFRRFCNIRSVHFPALWHILPDWISVFSATILKPHEPHPALQKVFRIPLTLPVPVQDTSSGFLHIVFHRYESLLRYFFDAPHSLSAHSDILRFLYKGDFAVSLLPDKPFSHQSAPSK